MCVLRRCFVKVFCFAECERSAYAQMKYTQSLFREFSLGRRLPCLSVDVCHRLFGEWFCRYTEVLCFVSVFGTSVFNKH